MNPKELATSLVNEINYTYSIIEDAYYKYNGLYYDIVNDNLLNKMICNKYNYNNGRSKIVIDEMKLNSNFVDISKSYKIINGKDLWKNK